MENKFDLIVIGAGPGGYPSAIRAAQRGMEVLVIENSETGGECLNWGCIPTKAYLEASSFLKKVKSVKKMGITAEVSFDYSKIVNYKDKTVSRLKKGIETIFKKRGITYLKGEVVDLEKGKVILKNGDTYEAKNILIATGSSPLEFSAFPFSNRILSNRSVFSLTQLPQSLAILGGGIMGCEFAQFFSALGVKVTLIEKMPRLLPNQSEWLSQFVEKSFKRNKIKVILDDSLLKVTETPDKVTLFTEKGVELEADYLLITIGRKRNSEFLKGKVEMDEKGMILTDEKGETSIEGVYAIGDVASYQMLAHYATFSGLKVVDYLTKGESEIDLNLIPAVIFTSPPMAVVGKVSSQFGESGYGQAGIAVIKDGIEGKIRLYVDEEKRIIGGEIVGLDSESLIMEIAMAIKMKAQIEDLTSLVHPHPTLSELVLEAGEDVFGEAIHKI